MAYRGSKYEVPEYAAMVRRMTVALARRVVESGDATSLRELVALGELAGAVLTDSAAALHDAGHSWTVIGGALGIKRQSAQQRFSPGL